MKGNFMLFKKSTLILSLFYCSLWAQKKHDLRYANPELRSELISKAKSFKNKAHSLKKINSNKDRKNRTHIRYQQTYQGIPVWGQHIISHEKDGNVVLSGNYFEGFEKLLDSGASSKRKTRFMDKLIKDYLKKHNLSNADVYNKSIQDFLYPQGNTLIHAFEVNFHVQASSQQYSSNPSFLINSKTLKILREWNNHNHVLSGRGPGGNSTHGYYEYGTDKPSFDITVQGNTCIMENDKVRVADMDGTFNRSHIEYGQWGSQTWVLTDFPTIQFDCYFNTYKEINGSYSPFNDAMYSGNKFEEMFQTWYGKSALIKPDTNIKIDIHVNWSASNAEWYNNRVYIGNQFYQDNIAYHALATPGIIGHEIAHGITEYGSQLNPGPNQSGALNEAFSDLANEAIEYFINGYSDWKVAAKASKSPQYALRYFETPEDDWHSISHMNDLASANNNKYYMGGIYRKAFYQLSLHNDWDVKAIFDVFLHANQNYWQPTSDFESALCDVISASIDLGYDAFDIIDAFKTVGLECTGQKILHFSVNDDFDYPVKIPYNVVNQTPEEIKLKAEVGFDNVSLSITQTSYWGPLSSTLTRNLSASELTSLEAGTFDLRDFCSQHGCTLNFNEMYEVELTIVGTTISKALTIQLNQPNINLYTINSNHSSNLDVNIASPAMMKGEASHSTKFFVSIETSDQWWGRYGDEKMAWLNEIDNRKVLDGTFNLIEFCEKHNFSLASNKYYRVALATGNSWIGKVKLIHTFAD